MQVGVDALAKVVVNVREGSMTDLTRGELHSFSPVVPRNANASNTLSRAHPLSGTRSGRGYNANSGGLETCMYKANLQKVHSAVLLGKE